MSSDENERMELDGIELSEDMLFYGSAVKLEELVNLAGRCIDEIESSDNVRIIVIETWLFIDFCIRELLISGLNLDRLNIDAFDLRIELLPRNFRHCINLITSLRDSHSNLLRDPQEKAIKMPIQYWFCLKKKHPEFFKQILDIEQEYYHEYAPELTAKANLEHMLSQSTIATIDDKSNQYSRISLGWLEAVDRIDTDWLNSVEKLNDARNFAAHSYDSTRILKRMGFSGKNAITHLKEKCIALLHDLIGITKVMKGKDSLTK